MRQKLFFVLAVSTTIMPVYAASDLDQLQALAQRDFRILSEDLGSALGYKALAPAEPLGVTGFDIGIEITGTKVDSNVWNRATSSTDSLDTLYIPKLHAHKGLPLGFDIGAFYSAVPTTNITLFGGELRYAIVEGNAAFPAIAVRGTYSMLSGVDQLDLDTKGLEFTISKGVALVTPYAGIGQYWVTSQPKGVAANAGLTEETFSEAKYFVGANLNLGVINLAAEADRSGDSGTFGLKAGLRF